MSRADFDSEARRLRESEDETNDTAGIRSPAWQPGYIRRFPLVGAVSLAAVIFCPAGSVAVLLASDWVSSTKWTTWLAPNVCL